MPKVFISYRREQSAGYAGRLYDALAARFGDRNVFMDVDLSPGIDFVERIGEAIGDCDALLVVIGPGWASAAGDESGPRLAAANDFVRHELETGLRSPDVSVVPLLVGGARMPGPDELPASVRELARRNALELSDTRWRYDVGRLLGTLEQGARGPEPAPPDASARATQWARPHGRRALVGALGVTLAIGLGIAALALGGVFADDPAGETPSKSGGSGGLRDFTTADGVRRMKEYERAFEAKDAQRLGAMMASDVVLRQDGGELRGRDKVIADHRRTFRAYGAENPTLELVNDNQDSDEGDVEVDGEYALTVPQQAPENGRFRMQMHGIGTQLLITELCFDCPAVRSSGD
jgi:TIR domain/SnoaL-like domain